MAYSTLYRPVNTHLLTVLIILSLFLQAIIPAFAYAETSSDTTNPALVEGSALQSSLVEEPTAEDESVISEEEEEEDDEEEEESEVVNFLDDTNEDTETSDESDGTAGPDGAGTVEVGTGDAVAGLEVDNIVNTLEVAVAPDQDNTSNASTTNFATTTTNATSAAETGSNIATGSDTTITTGDAIAYVDVLNVVNTNIVNSDGLISFINDTLGYGSFDLRSDFELTYAHFDTAVSTPNCASDICLPNNHLSHSSTNTAVIDNNLTVIADTGLNTASGDTASISTGDAYASANIINLANTNIVDSQYLLLIFNNFNDFTGDIILPNSGFFNQYLTGGGLSSGDVSLTNQANIENTTQVTAHTGNNEATGESSTIETGSAVAFSDTTNYINQNSIGDNTFSLLIRVHGNWGGTVSGLPDGMSWQETEQGIAIFSTGSTPGLPVHTSSVETVNDATIRNNVQVYALTGDNLANGGTASIKTGNAYAGSAIMNIANTNIIGSNWTNLIFTIYGNWNGNLTFGQPDLWLGVTAHSPDQPIMPGSLVTYTFTVFNRGDTTAPDVVLDSLFENNTLSFSEGDKQPFERTHTSQQWSLGDIGAGETKEFTHVARVNENINGRTVSAIPLVSRVSSSLRDANEEDNEEVVTIYVGRNRSSSNSNRTTFPANFDITKTASHDSAQPGDVVDYTITLFNRGGPLFDSLLVDALLDEAGEIVQEQTWPLAEIQTWETVTVSYSIKIDPQLPAGTYTNQAQLVGFHESKIERHQKPYESAVANHKLLVDFNPTGRVLGIQTSACAPYLTTYLRYGANNDSIEVKKLQLFLNQQLSRSIPVSGIFDRATEQAVRDFQIIHRDEILTPWGLTRDSGYVYYTTQKKINEIMCQGTSFPLSSAQMAEVHAHRAIMLDRPLLGFTADEQTPIIPPVKDINQAVITVPSPREPITQSETPPVPQLVIPSPETTVTGTRSWLSTMRAWWQKLIP